MVYGSVRVAVLLYTLWPVLAGPFCLPIFFNLPSSSRSYAIPSQHWDTGGLGCVCVCAAGGGVASRLTLQPTRGQMVGMCVCLYRPQKASLGPSCGSPPTPYLTPASTVELSPNPALARICSSNTDFPSEPSCLVRTRQRKSKNESEEKGKACRDVVSSGRRRAGATPRPPRSPGPPGPSARLPAESRTLLNQHAVLSLPRTDLSKTSVHFVFIE